MNIEPNSSTNPYINFSGEWITLVDSPPKISYDNSDDDIEMSVLLRFRVGNKEFNGFYCSDSEMGWVIDEDGCEACYGIGEIEYQRPRG